MTAKPLASVVTATFNSGKTIEKTMQSVLAQTYDHIEYIIADGNSSDDTMEIVESYRRRFEERGYVFKTAAGSDTGIYAGMNKGIVLATGEIVGIVNSDDFYEPEAVEIAVRAYIKTDFDLFYADLYIADKNGKVLRTKTAKRMHHYFTTRHWNHPTTFVPRRLYCLQLYDEKFAYYGDWKFVLWILKNYQKIVVVHKPLSNFRLGGRTTHRNRKILRRKFWERYKGYRHNGCSRMYFFECFFMDYGKEAVLKIFGNEYFQGKGFKGWKDLR